MAECAVEGCSGRAKSRGWCQAHYMRWWTTGDVGQAEVVRKPRGRTCSIDGCDRKHAGRGFCEGHLRRFKATGDPGPADFEPRRPKGDPCGVDGCERARYAKGVCEMHYQRMRDHGSLEAPIHYRWTGDSATYNAVHLRLRAQRGQPSTHTCRCGAPAEQWAYIRGDDECVRYDDEGRPYSTDLNHYEAMCRTCHRRMDADATRTWGCSVPGCDGEHKARGMCNRHYRQELKG